MIKKFTILCLLPLRVLHTKFGDYSASRLEKDMFTHVAKQTTDDNGRQSIAIGHLSDASGLKKDKQLTQDS